MVVPLMAELSAKGEEPEILFWVGCSGSFDQRAQKITRAFIRILEHIGIRYAILGREESCTGDPARRAGNEFLFQMMVLGNGFTSSCSISMWYGNNYFFFILNLFFHCWLVLLYVVDYLCKS